MINYSFQLLLGFITFLVNYTQMNSTPHRVGSMILTNLNTFLSASPIRERASSDCLIM